ncbi:hypothetical protein [Plesiomonas shigelloides]|uniref:hypothetical protein n=1 Tax=Plesiomonas shigelloides TaxID=703 RepID=UPI00126198CE|nr:hypothetical protein [Plesiomonas shigelloides]KAB7675280.1 hypothetical protein GBN23_11765 [Plesiomonas shigelloides]MCQ8860066.1 hypothetical protein [Plesiomonas shigelloides]
MQNKIVGTCAVAATFGFGLWFYSEPSFEPGIGFIASIGALAANYWPSMKAKYASKRQKGRKSFDYSNNNGIYSIGSDELKFDTKWTKASGDSIHVYNDPASIKGIALVNGVPSIDMISDAKSYDYSSRTRTPQEGDIVIFQNTYGHFAAVKIIDIKDNTRGDSSDELTMEYVINAKGSPDFR